MLYTFSQAHYSETDLQRYLTEITEMMRWFCGKMVCC